MSQPRFDIICKGKTFDVRITTTTGWSKGRMSYRGLMRALKGHNPEIGNIAYVEGG